MKMKSCRSLNPPTCPRSRQKKGETVLAVNVDFEAYRCALDNRSVKKNCTLPSWLNDKAEKANINFSASLQRALKEELGLNSN